MEDSEKLIAEINKMFKQNVIGYAKDMDIKMKRVSSGSLSLDWALGGGFPLKRIIELYGPYSSGKTLIAMKTIAQAQKMGLPTVFIDAEKSFEKEHAEAAGIDLSKLLYVDTSAGEKIFDFLRKLMEKIPNGVVVIDSVAAIVPLYEDENEIGKATMGLTARLMSKGLRIINAVNQGWSVIFINQVREKIGVIYGNPEITSGGRALGFFASLRVNVRSGEKYEDDKKKIGQEVKFRVEKSKAGMPGRDGSFRYMYETGVDKYDDTIALALRLGIIEQGGAWYTVLGQRFQGRAAIEEKAKTDNDFFEKLEQTIQKKWNNEKDHS